MSLRKNENFNDHSNEAEQIDLIDLMVQLWQGKVTIAICFIAAFFLAAGYIMIAKDKWTSTAIITQPDLGQISSYTSAKKIVYGENAPKLNEIQAEFFARFNSSLTVLSSSLGNKKEPEKLVIEPAQLGKPLPLRVSYTALTAKEAQKKLSAYIQQVNLDVINAIEQDLKANIISQKNFLEASLKTQEKIAVDQKLQQIEQIRQALVIAEHSKIQHPYINQLAQVSPDNMFMLGSDALSAMLRNESTRPLEFSDDYYKTRLMILGVNKLLVMGRGNQLKIDLQAYRYITQPTFPARRESPKDIRIIILAAILGSIVGVIVVVFRNMLRKYKLRA